MGLFQTWAASCAPTRGFAGWLRLLSLLSLPSPLGGAAASLASSRRCKTKQSHFYALAVSWEKQSQCPTLLPHLCSNAPARSNASATYNKQFLASSKAVDKADRRGLMRALLFRLHSPATASFDADNALPPLRSPISAIISQRVQLMSVHDAVSRVHDVDR